MARRITGPSEVMKSKPQQKPTRRSPRLLERVVSNKRPRAVDEQEIAPTPKREELDSASLKRKTEADTVTGLSLSSLWVEQWVNDTVAEGPNIEEEEKVIEEPPAQGGFIRMPSDYTDTVSTSQTTEPYDLFYYEKLEQYHVYIERFDPPQELVKEIEELVMKPRPGEMDITLANKAARCSRYLRRQPEQQVMQCLLDFLLPTWPQRSKKICQSSNSSWSRAFPLRPSATVHIPSPLFPPKPDTAFSIASTVQLSLKQMKAIHSLHSDDVCYAKPDPRGGWFPFLVLEVKAVATKGTRYVGTDQASLDGAVMLGALHDLYTLATNKDLAAELRPLFFSIVMDHEVAAINFHWLGEYNGEMTMNLEQIAICALRRPADVQLLQRVMYNIMDWAEKTYIPWIGDLLDQYADRSDSEFTATKQDPSERQSVDGESN